MKGAEGECFCFPLRVLGSNGGHMGNTVDDLGGGNCCCVNRKWNSLCQC